MIDSGRKEIPRTPLLMFPDGSFARSADIPEGCVVVEEPPLYEDIPVDNQTEAVLGIVKDE